MKILDVEAHSGRCTITTTEGTYQRWPGREVNGLQWWSYTNGAGRPTLVTVPATVQALEAEHLTASGPARPHLRLIKGAA